VDWTIQRTTLAVPAGTLTIEVTRSEDQSTYTETLVPPVEITTTQYVTQVVSYADKRRMLITPSGRGIVIDELGYGEIHTVHVVAYDKAGNKTKSDPLRFIVRPSRATPTVTPTP
jgi:hypothetical protein